MRRYLSLPVLLWLAAVFVCVGIVSRSQFVADMSAFLPRNPTAQQQILVDQITRGSLSRTLLMGIEGGTPEQRAQLSEQLAQSLRQTEKFSLVSNGESLAQGQEAEFFINNRYLLSAGVNAEKFTQAGLNQAFSKSINGLSTSFGSALKPLLPRDPTGEVLELLSNFDSANRPQSIDGVWASKDGNRAILIALSKADGADTDAQEALLQTINQEFDAAKAQTKVSDAKLLISGSAVFAVDARKTIKEEVFRLSLLGMFGVLALLLFAFRSARAVGLCALPVLSGALAGTAAVSLVFGSVHGITIGFGCTLIGEAVDYSIYYFIQSQAGAGLGAAEAKKHWLKNFWPTIRLGTLTSICGYFALTFSGFPGLAQLGVYSIAGLIAAALATRFVLPQFPLQTKKVFSFSAPSIARFQAVINFLGKLPKWTMAVAVVAFAFLCVEQSRIWNPSLSGLSPLSPTAQALDESLRADLGAPQMRFLMVVEGENQEMALRGAEKISEQLHQLQKNGVIEGYESPSKFIPSQRTQALRQQALPDAQTLLALVPAALADLPIQADRLKPFLADVEKARTQPLLTRQSLGSGSLALTFDALMMKGERGISAFLPIRQGNVEGLTPEQTETRALNTFKVLNQLAHDAPMEAGMKVSFIDMGEESVQIYSKYFDEILLLSGIGLLGIVALLGVSLKNARHTLAVLLPLVLSVLFVMAGLVAAGERLTLLHLVGMLLVFAVGSNYALFFNQRPRERQEDGKSSQAVRLPPTTLGALLLANTSTAIGFGVLAFSSVPVLRALGTTVAPGAVFALLLSAAFAVNLKLEEEPLSEVTAADEPARSA